MAAVDIEIDDKADWSYKSEAEFIRILHEWVKKGELQSTTFKASVWAKIENELFVASNKRYSIKQLKAKFNRLRKKHREFCNLIDHTGFSWDPVTNTVIAAEDVWADYVKQVPGTKQYRKKGLEHYEYLSEIFNTTTTRAGQMHFSCNQIPQQSGDEREVEDRHVNNENQDDIDEDSDSMVQSVGFIERGNKRRQHVGTSSEHCPKRWEGMEYYMKTCDDLTSQTLVLAKEKSAVSTLAKEKSVELTRAKVKISELTRCLEISAKLICAKEQIAELTHELEKSAELMRDQEKSAESINKFGSSFTMEECLEIIDAMKVETSKFVKIMDRFLDVEFRHFFIIMGDEKRRAWVDSVK